MIIEDEALIAADIRGILEDHGALTFDVAETEEEAIRAAELRAPDFITSDVNLLCGTGPAAVASIQRRLGSIPVLFITATPEACQPCDRNSQVLAKPFNEASVVRAFKSLHTDIPWAV